MLKWRIGLKYQPDMISAVGFTRHARVIFILCRGDPRGAEQRQASEEIEESHQPQHRTKGRAGGRLHQRRQRIGHHNLEHLKTNGGNQRPTDQRLLARTMAGQTPEDPEEQKVVSKDRNGQPNAAPGRFQPFNVIRYSAEIIICCAEPATEVMESVMTSATSSPISEIKSRKYFTHIFS